MTVNIVDIVNIMNIIVVVLYCTIDCVYCECECECECPVLNGHDTKMRRDLEL